MQKNDDERKYLDLGIRRWCDTICDIVFDTASKQNWLLTDKAQLSAKPLCVYLADINTVQSNGAWMGKVKSLQKRNLRDLSFSLLMFKKSCLKKPFCRLLLVSLLIVYRNQIGGFKSNFMFNISIVFYITPYDTTLSTPTTSHKSNSLPSWNLYLVIHRSNKSSAHIFKDRQGY